MTQTRIKAMVSDDDVVLFMKGTPNAPQCGFSNMACRVLDLYEVDYHVRGDALRGRWEGSRGLRVCAACPALLSVSCWRPANISGYGSQTSRECTLVMVAFLMAMRVTSLWLLLRVPLLLLPLLLLPLLLPPLLLPLLLLPPLLLPLLSKLLLLLWHC